MTALFCGHLEVVDVLLEMYLAKVGQIDWTEPAYLNAALHGFGDASTVEWVFERREAVGLPTCPQDALYHVAVSRAPVCQVREKLTLLLSRGCDPNGCVNGTTPLAAIVSQWSCKHGLAAALLDGGADPNRGSVDGDFPLHRVVRQCNVVCARMLMDHGADVATNTSEGMAPIHIAAGTCDIDMVEMIALAGGDLQLLSVQGETPLHLAAQYGSQAVVQYLLDHGADPTVKDARGRTPLDLARRRPVNCEHRQQVIAILHAMQSN